MTLEHLVEQFWFPKLGLLISKNGLVWRHSFLGPFQPGFLTSVKEIVDVAGPDGAPRPTVLPGQALRRSENSRASGC